MTLNDYLIMHEEKIKNHWSAPFDEEAISRDQEKLVLLRTITSLQEDLEWAHERIRQLCDHTATPRRKGGKL